MLRRPTAQYVRVSLQEPVLPEIRRRPQCLRLAVPAWVRKVTPRFLRTCREIGERAGRRVEFWFFPNMRGACYQAIRRRYTRELPSRVFPSVPYRKYIETLNRCDIHLSTFPFGSSNGIVDSVLQGLPAVNLLGEEPHARVDAMLLRRVAQPDWLTATDVAGYIDAILRLVQDDDLRVDISEAILAGDPAGKLILDDNAEAGDLAEILHLVHRHHPRIRGSGRQVWRHDDLLALDTGATSAAPATAADPS